MLFRSQAAVDKKTVKIFSYEGNDANSESASDWVLISSRPGFFEKEDVSRAGKDITPIPGLKLWTDDYSNIVSILSLN